MWDNPSRSPLTELTLGKETGKDLGQRPPLISQRGPQRLGCSSLTCSQECVPAEASLDGHKAPEGLPVLSKARPVLEFFLQRTVMASILLGHSSVAARSPVMQEAVGLVLGMESLGS